jgi:hypothetical protein
VESAPLPFAGSLKEARDHDVIFWGLPTKLMDVKVPQLADVEAVTTAFDCGKEVKLNLSAQCSDEDCVRPLAKTARGLVDLLRAQLLMMSGLKDVKGLVPDFNDVELGWVPWKLLRVIVKGLDDAKVQAEGKSLTVCVAIPLEARTLRREIERTLTRLTDSGKLDLSSVLPAFATRPQGVPALGSGWNSPTPAAPPPPPISAWNTFGPPADPLTAKPQEGAKSPQGVQQALATEPASSPPPKEVAEPVKLTVANVRKETALLFEMDRDGKLSFVQKLPAGEAVDVKTIATRRLIALFPDKAVGESFEATTSATIWLLR